MNMIYVASRASIPERSAMWRNLRAQGHNIISTWIDEAQTEETLDWGNLLDRCVREAAIAHRLVLYAESGDFPLRLAYMDVGVALCANVPIVIVCPIGLDRTIDRLLKHPRVFHASDVRQAMEMDLGTNRTMTSELALLTKGSQNVNHK